MEEEIINQPENNILNDIDKDNLIRENIQISFSDYFFQNLKELPPFFINYSIPKTELNIKRFLNEKNENKNLLDLLPIKVIDSENFIKPYYERIELFHKKPNKIPYFTNFEQNEIQLLCLLNSTHLANNKIEKYKEFKNEDNMTNNHLVKINNIIKANPDLIGYIYILKWLQKILTLNYEEFNTDVKTYEINNERKKFSEEVLDPIKLEEICQNESNEEYNNLMKQFSYNLFKGNISLCEEICQKRNIEEFSNVFSGGCPLFDKVISNENDYINFDQDLISPSMNNKDYQDFINFIKNNSNNYNYNENDERNIYGNSLYILWMQVMYENANYSKNGSLLNYLFRLVSGNYKDYELNNNNVYEYLYINILNLLHSKIFNELTKNPEHKMVQYHYIEPESFKEISQVINNGGRTIFSIIDNIIQNNNYISLNKRHPLLWLELYLIKLFFQKIEIIKSFLDAKIINKEENINKYFEYLNNILEKMKKINDFNYLDFDEIINNEREFNYLELNNRKMQAREFYDMINICLSRSYFSSLVNFYNIENYFFENIFNIDNTYGNKIEEIFKKFDDVFINYIKHIINLNDKDNLDLDIIIYITTFMFDIKSIIFILTEISHYIGTNEKYQEFIDYIQKYFGDIKYNEESLSIYLIRILTKNSNLLAITDDHKHNFNSIDEALNYYVENKINNQDNFLEEISDDDKYKINQIKCLFEQTKNSKLNKDTSFSYLLKLFVKFLVNYKFKEAYELKYQLRDYIYDSDTPTDELIYEKLQVTEEQIKKISEISENDDIQFLTILSCRYLFIIILDCFYYFANKIMFLYNTDNIINNKKNSRIKNKKYYFNSELGINAEQFLSKKIKYLFEFIKKVIDNEYFFNYSIKYFDEDTKKDFIKLIGDWSFQSIKFIYDIYKLGFVDKNKNDSLICVLKTLLYDNKIIDDNLNNRNLSDIIINNGRNEIKIFEILNEIQKQKVMETIYYMTKINKNYLEETFDDKFVEELEQKNNNIIQELEFNE